MKSDVLALYLTGALVLMKILIRLSHGSLLSPSDFVIVPLFGFIFWGNIKPVCDVLTGKNYITGWFGKDNTYLIFRDRNPYKYTVWVIVKVLVSWIAAEVVLANVE